MGCDVHLYVEVRRDGKWQHHDWRSKYAKGAYEDGSTEYDYMAMFKDPMYVGRNYDLFAMLANVRNGRGFAGCDTGDGFEPICEPKGLPDDVTPEVKAESDRWGEDGHSHSWHTLSDLLRYDWDQETHHRGWVSDEAYKAWVESGRGFPESWSGGVSGGMVEHVTNEDMDRLISGEIDRKDGKVYYTQIEWGAKYRESARRFLERVMPALKELGNEDDVRIVFWFDN